MKKRTVLLFSLILLLLQLIYFNSQAQIQKMEYFLNSDPGLGSATDIPITPDVEISATLNLSSTGLETGFQTIGVRAKDSDKWGLTRVQSFYYIKTSATNEITEIEYFVDTDNGFGSCTALSFTPATTISQAFTLDVSALSSGFHTLGIRAKTENGDWGATRTSNFYYIKTSLTNEITNVEYFIDNDPGFGMASDIAVTPGVSIESIIPVDVSTLTSGFHTFGIRAKTYNGDWGATKISNFYYIKTSLTNEITDIEYFIDTDPGFGSASAVSLTPGVTIESVIPVDVSSLATGFHTFGIRAKTNNGDWGATRTNHFYYMKSSAANVITNIEYFIDSDPGFDNATGISITSGNEVEASIPVDVSSLSEGFHTLGIRAKTDNGDWGATNIKRFYVFNSVLATQIIKAEYFIDSDPGIGNGISIDNQQVGDMDQSFMIDLSTVTAGAHKLFIRVQDETGRWSVTRIESFCKGVEAAFSAPLEVCAGSEFAITDASVGVVAETVYSWDFNNDGTVDNTTIGDVTHTYAHAGNYTIALVAGDGGACNDTVTKSITVLPGVIPTVLLTVDKLTSCQGEMVTFVVQTTYMGENPVFNWSVNGVSISNENDSLSRTDFANNDVVSCRITSDYMCTSTNLAISNTITLTVNPVLIPEIQISTPSTDLCTGETAQFTAVVSNAGSNPGLFWKILGAPVQSGSYTFNYSDVKNDDVISCDLAITENCCVSTAYVHSNEITMSVGNAITPTISINASSTSICGEDPITITSLITGGGSTPQYLWSINGVSTGETTSTFSTSSLKDGDKVTCQLTSSSTCVTTTTVNSNEITFTNNTPSFTIADYSPVCMGDTLVLKIESGNADQYEWSDDSGVIGTGLFVKITEASDITVVASKNGCSASKTESVTFNPSYHLSHKALAKEGETVVLNGEAFTKDVNFKVYTFTQHGCDSIIEFTAMFLIADTVFKGALICPGDSYLFEGTEYTSPGLHSVTLEGSKGQDSVRILSLDFYPGFETIINENVNKGESFNYNGTDYPVGNYSFTFTSMWGCDSIVNLNVIEIVPVDKSSLFSLISDAQNMLDTVVIGDSPGTFPQSAYDILSGEIAMAHVVYNNTESTQIEVDAAADKLQVAINTFKGSVNVPIPVTGISLNVSMMSLNVNDIDKLVPTIAPSEATNQNITWESANTDIATVSDYGVITAISRGVVIIKVTTQDGNYSASCELTVNDPNFIPVQNILCGDAFVFVNQTIALPVTISPENASIKLLTYTSLNSDIVSVSAEGEITGLIKGNAEIQISATDGSGVSITINVMVEDKPVVDKSLLAEAIAKAQNMLDTIEVGTLGGQYPLSAYNALQDALNQAIVVFEGDFANQSDVEDERQNLESVMQQFIASVIVKKYIVFNQFTTICSGENFEFNGTYLDKSGTYERIAYLDDQTDSLIKLQLTVNPVYLNENYVVLKEGESYSFGGNSYNSEGSFDIVSQSIHGCDSILRLNISVLYADSVFVQQKICSGESFVFEGEEYSTSGTYLKSFTGTHGEDSIRILILTVEPSYQKHVYETINEGESFSFGGSDLTAQGTYPQSFSSIAGCDSTITLHLTVIPVGTLYSEKSAHVCNGQSYSFGSLELTQAGVYQQMFTSTGGLDSLVQLTLDIDSTYDIHLYKTIFEGESYKFGPFNFTSTGVYPASYSTTKGCDSLITLHLSVIPKEPIYTTINESICVGGSFKFGNTFYTDAGQYEMTLLTSNGRDSIITLNLSVKPLYNISIEETIIEGDSYSFNGTDYSQAGDYIANLTSVYGCDSTVTLHLFVLPQNPVYDTLEVSICSGESFTFGGTDYATSGEYHATFKAVSGQDSIVTMYLTVNQVYDLDVNETINEGDSFAFNGTEYSVSGDYTANLSSIHGCDSTVTLHLTVEPVVNTYNITFTISSGTGDISGAHVTLGSVTLITDNAGAVTFSDLASATNVEYTVTASGYQNYSGIVDIDSDKNIPVTLTKIVEVYSVGFVFSYNGNILSGVELSINGNTYLSDENGSVLVDDLTAQTALSYTVSLDGYDSQTGQIDVPHSQVVSIEMIPTQTVIMETVEFVVFDDLQNPVSGAVLTINGNDYTTDETGIFSISLEAGVEVYFQISKSGYQTLGDYFIPVTGQSNSYIVHLSKIVSQTYTFVITVGSTPVKGAKIEIDGQTLYSDINGLATYTGLVSENISYSLSAKGYFDKTGEITSSSSNLINVKMISDGTITNLETPLNDSISVYPNPAKEKVFIEIQSGTFYCIELYDDNAALICKYPVHSSESEIDIKHLSNGIYQLIFKGENSVVKTLIKK